jgi:hypothetical protein
MATFQVKYPAVFIYYANTTRIGYFLFWELIIPELLKGDTAAIILDGVKIVQKK